MLLSWQRIYTLIMHVQIIHMVRLSWILQVLNPQGSSDESSSSYYSNILKKLAVRMILVLILAEIKLMKSLIEYLNITKLQNRMSIRSLHKHHKIFKHVDNPGMWCTADFSSSENSHYIGCG